MVKTLTDDNFEQATAKGVTLTDFWATWCPPCKMQGPIVDQLDQEIGDKVGFGKMDVDQNKQTPAKFGIQAIPTMIVKKDGKVVERIVGLHMKEQLKQILGKYANLN